MPKHISQHLEELEKTLGSRGKEPELSLKMTPELSSKIWGIKKGQLSLIGARTSQGKSALALQIAYDLSSQGHPVLFISLEMTVIGILERLFCLAQEVNNEDILKGEFSKHKDRFEDFKKESKGLNLVIADCIGQTWKGIDEYINDLQTKPEVIIVDYIQTISSMGTNQKVVIDEYVRHFREMAIRRNFAGIICSQVNRTSQESDDKQPQLHQLKGSGFLEEHSDIIMLLHWPYKYNNSKLINEYQLNIAKNRNGRTGYVDLIYLPNFYMFKDWSEMERKRLDSAENKKEWD